ncbi:hypothetical protein SLINC_1444 [Streptomyces lincolnensis]|uniref:Uncharacterized protein n=1 Tax=Streptomyces lincolnensis TaxID=1915 RepID=A0A1B1M4T5_STRLN|nr:hypothetical protein [Streptomyces lincolnensis]ANS63668.1 hypothetical protein SLINC_1444 [Streptomyces lincolnensis]
MGFNPLEHQGIPLERQVRSRRELDVEPVDPDHEPGGRTGRRPA